MDPKSKRRIELNQQMKAHKDAIIEAAIREFIINGIDNSKITDIARHAEVGAATIYRYFETKPKLVIECATKLWSGEVNGLMPRLNPKNFNKLSGFEQMQEILSIFGSLFEECSVLLQLLEQFDNYIAKEKVPKEQLQKYEKGILDLRSITLKAIQKGQKDGSIRPEIDGKQFYMTASHAIMALSQKLLLRGNILQSDNDFDAKTQILSLIDMELYYIKGVEKFTEIE